MKKIILLTLYFFPILISAQITTVETVELPINFHKTTLLKFKTDIKYFSSGSKDFICAKPDKIGTKDKVDNVLLIKAVSSIMNNNRSNITVVTNDGLIHSFIVYFTEETPYCCIDVSKIENHTITSNAIIDSQNLYLSDSNNIHVAFPSKLTHVGFGSQEIKVFKVKETENIIQASTTTKDFTETNIIAITDNGNFYPFDVNYRETINEFNIIVNNDISEPSNEIAIFNQDIVSDNEVNNLVEKVFDHDRQLYHLSQKKQGINFIINNIYVRNDIILLDMSLENKDNIDYDIEFIKFYIRDKKITKRTATQDDYKNYLFNDSWKSNIIGKESNRFIYAFEKFTIPNAKVFIIHIQEKNGGRNILFELKNKDFINAKPI